MKKIFKISGNCSFIFIMSLLTGFPSNSKYSLSSIIQKTSCIIAQHHNYRLFYNKYKRFSLIYYICTNRNFLYNRNKRKKIRISSTYKILHLLYLLTNGQCTKNDIVDDFKKLGININKPSINKYIERLQKNHLAIEKLKEKN